MTGFAGTVLGLGARSDCGGLGGMGGCGGTASCCVSAGLQVTLKLEGGEVTSLGDTVRMR